MDAQLKSLIAFATISVVLFLSVDVVSVSVVCFCRTACVAACSPVCLSACLPDCLTGFHNLRGSASMKKSTSSFCLGKEMLPKKKAEQISFSLVVSYQVGVLELQS